MSSADKYKTENIKQEWSFFYPTSGSSGRDVEFLAKAREDVSKPPYRYNTDQREKTAATADSDRAARDREAAGVAGRDFAYSFSDSKHSDSKKHPR